MANEYPFYNPLVQDPIYGPSLENKNNWWFFEGEHLSKFFTLQEMLILRETVGDQDLLVQNILKSRLKKKTIAGGPFDLPGGITTWFEKDGKKHGELTYIDDNGMLRYQANYKNDLQHGLETYREENGTLRFQIDYKNGLLHGIMQRWSPRGMLFEKKNYVNDKENGLWERWYDNGARERITEMVNGLKHGRESLYNQYGLLTFYGFYENGVLMNGQRVY